MSNKPGHTESLRLTGRTEVVTIDWRMVESENYKQYIANLRSIGCPEETIRDIIIAPEEDRATV